VDFNTVPENLDAIGIGIWGGDPGQDDASSVKRGLVRWSQQSGG
jgi:hypothetical protein